jgi:O-antigen/teichoic acid export membrane protein
MIILIDQAIVSGVNFATALILARFLSPTSYGYYALLFAILLFINGQQSALITAPLMVLAPRYEAQHRVRYFNSLWVIQLTGCLATGALVVALMLVDHHWWPHITSAIAIGPFVLTIMTYLGQEFVRRMMFSQRDSIGGLCVDLISYGLQFVTIIVLIALEAITLDSVFWAMGLTSLISCVFGYIRLRPTITSVRRAHISSTLQQHWKQGRWLVSSMLAQWSSNQPYLFVVAALLSPADTAMLAASRNLLGITNIFLQGLENYVPTTLMRRLMSGGIDAMVRWVTRFRLIASLFIGAYCLIVAIFAGSIIRFVFGSNYASAGPVVALMAVAYFMLPFKYIQVFGLRAMGQPRWIFFAQLIGAVVTVTISVPLVTYWGIIGAAIGVVITHLVVLIVAHIGYRRVVDTMKASSKSGSADYMLTTDPETL